MKRIIATLTAVAAMAGAAPAFAGAENFTPSNAAFNLTGSLTVKQSSTLTCNANFGLKFNGTTSAQLTSASLTSGLCGLVSFPNANGRPITIDNPPASGSGAATVLRIHGLQVTTLLGSCTGDVLVNWNNVTKQATFSNATITGGCSINGVLNSSNSSVSAIRL